MSDTASSRILVAEEEGIYLIKLVGDVRVVLCCCLNDYIETIFSKGDAKEVVIDLMDASGADSTTLGLLAKLAIFSKREFSLKPKVFCHHDEIFKTLETMGFDDIFEIIDGEAPTSTELKALSEDAVDMELCRKNVLEAHKLLVELNPESRSDFMDLIRTLESQ
jgi:anti-anti-sigma factor